LLAAGVKAGDYRGHCHASLDLQGESMTPRQLQDLRVLYHLALLSDLTVRNTTILLTMKMRMDGNTSATLRDGAKAAEALIEEVTRRSEQFLLNSGAMPAEQKHLNADEFRDIGEKLKAFATGFASEGM
jgi:hypothetical protein